ncbi:MAG: tyrosine-type recombinase/integrase [Nitrospiria bacterium]
MSDSSKNPSIHSPGIENLPPEPPKLYAVTDNKLYENIDVYLFNLSKEVSQNSRSQDTFKTYQRVLKYFYSWSKQRGFPAVDPAYINRYKQHLIDQKFSPSTVNLYLAPLRVFFQYYLDRKFISYNPARFVKGIRRKQRVHKKSPLAVEEAKRLLNAILPDNQVAPDSLMQLRDFAMIYLMLKTGLRAVEVSRAKVGDIKTSKGDKVLFVHGKGDKEKNYGVVLQPEVYHALMDYFSARGSKKPDDPLFATLDKITKSKPPQPISRRTIRYIVVSYLRKAGLKSADESQPEIATHSLRHTCANLALDGGAPIDQVQEMLRHSEIETTMIYLRQWNRVEKAAEKHITQI